MVFVLCSVISALAAKRPLALPDESILTHVRNRPEALMASRLLGARVRRGPRWASERTACGHSLRVRLAAVGSEGSGRRSRSL